MPSPPPFPDWLDSTPALFLDVDGTLLEFAETPDAVVLPGARAIRLAELDWLTGGSLALVSGRTIADLDRIFDPLRLPAGGVHGAELRRSAGGAIEQLHDGELGDVVTRLREFARQHEGLLIEAKGASVATHFRRAPHLAEAVREAVDAVAVERPDCEVLAGHMVRELRITGVDKGTAIAALLESPGFSGRRPVFLGDDTTDEAGFRETRARGGISIRVGVSADETAAEYRLPDVDAVWDWIASLCSRLTEVPRDG